MQLFLRLIFVFGAATALGLISAWQALEAGFAADERFANPWQIEVGFGGREANPYTQARLARSIQAPLDPSEALVFIARQDQDLRNLDGNCTYKLVSPALDALWWTLTIERQNGALFSSNSDRYGYTNVSILRQKDNSFIINLSPDVLPGNWIQTPENGTFQLTLRLYDTPMLSNGGLERPTLPTITKVSCE